MKRKSMTYNQFCRKYNIARLDVPAIKRLQKKHNVQIQDLHNIIDDAKLDGRL